MIGDQLIGYFVRTWYLIDLLYLDDHGAADDEVEGDTDMSFLDHHAAVIKRIVEDDPGQLLLGRRWVLTETLQPYDDVLWSTEIECNQEMKIESLNWLFLPCSRRLFYI